MEIVKYPPPHYDPHYRGNGMRRSLSCMIVGLLMISVIPAIEIDGEGTRDPGNVLFVSESGSTYTRIRDAIDNATAGDTIYVAPGNYDHGFVLLKDDVNIIGNSSEGDVNIRFDRAEAIVGISSDNSTISGLTLIEDGGHIFCLMIGQCENVTLKDISIKTELSHAIYISDCIDIDMRDIEIDHGERKAIEARDVNGLVINGFSMNSSESPDGIIFVGGCYGVELSNGVVTMDHVDSTFIRAEDGLDLMLDELDVSYQKEFINMEMGDVVSYDTFFGFDDVNITSSSVNDTFVSYVRKDILVREEGRDGEMVNSSGMELNLSTHLGTAYRTPYFGGTSGLSNSNGSFGGSFNFINFNQTGGEFEYTAGSGSLEAYHPYCDRNAMIEIEEIDLTNDAPIHLDFMDIWFTNGTIFGNIVHEGGPMDGEPVSNGTAYLWDYSVNTTFSRDHELAKEYPLDENGSFMIVDLDFSFYNQIWVYPEDTVEDGGFESGYTFNVLNVPHHWIVVGNFTNFQPGSFKKMEDYPDTYVSLSIPYYEYIPPNEGDIFGTVRFGIKGPLANEIAPNTTVMLYNLTEDLIGETISDAEGNYSFEDIPFGEGYELRAMPADDVLGVTNNISGYLFWDGSAFNHTGDTNQNISLKYYQHIPPSIKHPKVAIISEDNEPMKNVRVTVTIGEEEYIAYTNEDGIAEFDEIEGLSFPNGSSFMAEIDGYETIEWDHGDGIPKMKEEPMRDDDTLLVWILIAMIVIVLMVGTYLITRKRDQEIKEE